MEERPSLKRKSIRLPDKWKKKRKIGTIMQANLICCKCPLDESFSNLKPWERWTPSNLLTHKNLQGKEIGMVIDLTNTSRYYDGNVEFQQKGIEYIKEPLAGNGTKVNEEEIKALTAKIHAFVTQNEDKLCVIHCTHGLNRTGLIVCSYLCKYQYMTLDEAFTHFCEHRPDGIYRMSIVRQLESLLNQTLSETNKENLLND